MFRKPLLILLFCGVGIYLATESIRNLYSYVEYSHAFMVSLVFFETLVCGPNSWIPNPEPHIGTVR